MPHYPGADASILYFTAHGPRNASGTSVDTGAGETLVVLAGGAARHPEYLADLAGLDAHYRLVIPHLRGVGNSPLSVIADRNYWWHQADDIEQLRVCLGLETLAIVAHSAGTRVAIAYAAQYPQRVSCLVLITPPASYLVDVPSDIAALAESRQGEPDFDGAMALLEENPQLSDDRAIAQWQLATAPAGYATWGAREQAHASVGSWNLAASAAFFAGAPPENIAERLAKVTAPTLVIAGAQDCLTGLAPVLALAELFPAGETAVIECCGHYPWVEQPPAFADAITTFLVRALPVQLTAKPETLVP